MGNKQELVISPPNFQVAIFKIVGTAPYVSNKFSDEARKMMRDKQEAGPTVKKGAKKAPKDFEANYLGSMHKSEAGWYGIPASAFRNALVSACRIAGFQMTRAKLSVFVEADGFDEGDGTPLVKFTKGTPKKLESTVRLATGVCDIAARGCWSAGWEAQLRIKYDADQFTLKDVANLLMRVGVQVGVGAGRPDSKTSAGMGWGTFEIKGK